MTGNAFLKRLGFQLDFLKEEDQRVVLSYYEKKLSEASTLLEEEQIVKSFGSPELIASKLKETFLKHMSDEQTISENGSDSVDSAQQSDVPSIQTETPTSSSALSEESKKDSSSETLSAFESASADSDHSFDILEEQAPSLDEDASQSPISLSDDSETAETAEASEVQSDASEDWNKPADDLLFSQIDTKEDLSESFSKQASSESDESTEDSSFAQTSDVIFSKPQTAEKAPEVVYSFENNEVKSLFGEKVIIANREAPIEEVSLEDIDQENGFTKEEIEKAKADTLEKTENYKTEPIVLPKPLEEDEQSDDASLSEASIPSESDSSALPSLSSEEDETEKDWEEEEEIEEEEKKRFFGIFNLPFRKSTLPRSVIVLFKVFFTLFVLPFLVLFFGTVGILYLALVTVSLLISIVLFLLMIAMILASIIELVFGFSNLLTSIPVGLIEIGLGILVLGIVGVISAFFYELIFGSLPKLIKLTTRGIFKLFRLVFSFLYGGNA